MTKRAKPNNASDENDLNVTPPQAGEPMNDDQREYLELLTEEAGERLDPNLDQVAAARLIDELRVRTGRGVHEHPPRPS